MWVKWIKMSISNIFIKDLFYQQYLSFLLFFCSEEKQTYVFILVETFKLLILCYSQKLFYNVKKYWEWNPEEPLLKQVVVFVISAC